MFKFIVSSLSFKPSLSKKRLFFLVFETSEGVTVKTESVNYDLELNMCIFSEGLSIEFKRFQSSSLVKMEIYENEPLLKRNQLISTRMIMLTNDIINEINKKPMLLKTTIKNDIYLALHIETDLELDKLSPSEEKKDGILSPFFKEMEVFSKDQKGELEILNATKLNNAYIKRLTPLNMLSNYLYEVYSWASPVHTIIYGLVVSFWIIFTEHILVLILILFYFNTNFIIRKLMKIKKQRKISNMIERNKQKIDIYKKNIIHIQKAQKSYIKIYKNVKKLLFSEDKTELFSKIIGFRKYVPLIILLLAFIKFKYLILVCFWSHLVKKTVYVDNFLKNGTKNIETFFSIMDSKLSYYFLKIGLTEFIPNLSPEIQMHVLEPKSTHKKIFIIYENQRWWIGTGWTYSLLPHERSKYSDIDGKIELSFNYFNLPNTDDNEFSWIWEDDWKIEIIPDRTDADGWEYSYDFIGEFHANNNKIDCVRRRKWMRSCKQIEKKNINPMTIKPIET